jgi:hypothetical protein
MAVSVAPAATLTFVTPARDTPAVVYGEISKPVGAVVVLNVVPSEYHEFAAVGAV